MSLAATVNNLEATRHIQEGPNRELAAAQQEIEKLEEKLQIKKCPMAKLEWQLTKCKSEPETPGQTDNAQLWLVKDMQFNQVKNLSMEKSSLESKLIVFQSVIERLTTNQAQVTLGHPPGQFGILGSIEPIFCFSGHLFPPTDPWLVWTAWLPC